jgi:prevent-host-death family protein
MEVLMATVKLDLEADIQPVSDFRANSAEVLRQVKESGRPVVLTQRGRPAAVLVAIGPYQALLEEVEELRDVRNGLADADADRVVSNEAARRRLLARFATP